jgi:peptidoglycan/xylan/chitin deacetylase (PgdA/CDA1 family)
MGFIYSGSRKDNKITISFDDGPTNGVTNTILKELNARSIYANFFMIGSRIHSSPDLAKHVLAEGHEIGNHTFTHAKLDDLNAEQFEWELLRTQQIMAELLNHRAKWFRPPYGSLKATQMSTAESFGLEVVLWDVDSLDWSQPSEDRIVENIQKATRAGSIILCHDLYDQTARSVGRVLDNLLHDGFSFVTLSELLSSKP